MSKDISSHSKTNKVKQKQPIEDLLDKPIISVKEARKIIGKEASSRFSDEELGHIIGQMNFLANKMLDASLVPQKR